MVTRNSLRARVLSPIPLQERRLKLNGIVTAVLEGGDGPPLVLLHGAGGYAAHWMRVAPELLRSHRVVAPDLPGHGDSAIWDGAPDRERITAWLDDLIDCSCAARPIVVGETLGGAIAARYAAERSERLAALILVDALGIAEFAPTPEFGTALQEYLSTPTADSYGRLMHVCLFDLPKVAGEMGDTWHDIDAYNVDRALAPDRIEALGALMQHVGIPAIEPAALEAISVPTALIWGRQDRATPIAVAQRASDRYGWPLHVVEGSGDVPSIEQPAAFLAAFRAALEKRPVAKAS